MGSTPVGLNSLSGKITAAFVPVLMAVLRAISRAPMTWLRACLRPPLPESPLSAGTATAARSPMMPTTARSSTRVNAAAGRRECCNFCFLILNCRLAEEMGSCEVPGRMRCAAAAI